MIKTNNEDACGPAKRDRLTRREFVKFSASGVAAISGLGNLPVMAGPFEDNDYLKIIMEDKKLSPDWVRSLFSRGQKQVYSDRKSLNHIGMPIGGLFAGTVYLSGDGRLWLWDIFNRDQEGILPTTVTYKGKSLASRDGARYIEPAPVTIPFEQEFGVRVNVDGVKKDVSLNADGFETVSFNGRYPLGQVDYESSRLPLKAMLKAYSPFIPLYLDDSSLPATVMNYTITNTSDKIIEVDLYGKIQNPVCMETRSQTFGRLVNTVFKKNDFSAIYCFAEPESTKELRSDIVFEDFEKDTYDGWTVEGKAFGDGPVKIKDISDYQGDVGGKSNRVVNSHASAPGEEIFAKDGATGVLTSRTFTIERNFIAFLIGGGSHEAKACMNLLIDGEIAATATGDNNNRMSSAYFNVRSWQGKTAQLQIVDKVSGAWGNIGVDQVVFTDQPAQTDELTEQRGFGSMSLALFGNRPDDYAIAAEGTDENHRATGKLGDNLVGTIGTILKLKPGESQTVRFAVTWNFPNFYARGLGGQLVGHSYAARFDTALDVAEYIADNFEKLTGQTEKWVDTWYDSTLPYWLLDRTMANTSTLATTTCYRFKDGRFWAWEGIGCCPGTCTHVWHYAQAPGRVFETIAGCCC